MAAAAAADEQADIYSQPTIAQLQELGLELPPRPPTSFQLWCRHLREQVGKRGRGWWVVWVGGWGGLWQSALLVTRVAAPQFHQRRWPMRATCHIASL